MILRIEHMYQSHIYRGGLHEGAWANSPTLSSYRGADPPKEIYDLK